MARFTYFDFCGFVFLGLFTFICIVCGVTVVREYITSGYFVKSTCLLEGMSYLVLSFFNFVAKRKWPIDFRNSNRVLEKKILNEYSRRNKLMHSVD